MSIKNIEDSLNTVNNISVNLEKIDENKENIASNLEKINNIKKIYLKMYILFYHIIKRPKLISDKIFTMKNILCR